MLTLISGFYLYRLVLSIDFMIIPKDIQNINNVINSNEFIEFEYFETTLEKRELIKINILENSGMDPREAQHQLVGALGCEGVQVIGSKIVLYKESKDHKKIELPK